MIEPFPTKKAATSSGSACESRDASVVVAKGVEEGRGRDSGDDGEQESKSRMPNLI